jgi:hypothetical protein
MPDSKSRKKLTTQVDSALLVELKALARKEGRQIKHIVEEAILCYLEAKSGSKPRTHVMKAYMKTHGKYASLYKQLAQ